MGGEALSTGAGKTFVSKTLPTPQTDLYVRLWVEVVSRGTKVTLLRLRSAAGIQLVAVGTLTNGSLYLSNSVTDATLKGVGGLLPSGGWHMIQVHVAVGGSSSRTDVWFDGLWQSSLSGVTSLGTTQIGRVDVGESAGRGTYDVAFDDTVMNSTYSTPSAPTGVVPVWVSARSVRLSWEAAPAADGSVTWIVSRTSDPGAAPIIVGTSTSPGFVDTSVAGLTTYLYTIQAVDPAGHTSMASDPAVSVTTPAPPTVIPTTPTGLTAVIVTSSRVDLAWTFNPSQDDVLHYTVYRSALPSGSPVEVGTAATPSFSDTGVGPAASYRYVVSATNGIGESATSDPLDVNTPNAPDPVIAAAGDIACDPANASFAGTAGNCQSAATAALLGARQYSAVLPLGDTQYTCGGLAAFQASYATTWGSYLTTSMPVPGNHEYLDSATSTGTDCSAAHDAAGFYSYFATSPAFTGAIDGGQPTSGYYSFTLGSWHLIALNAECEYVGGCGPGSPLDAWLQADLAAHPSACTLAYWHQPRWSSGKHPSDPTYDQFWRDLYAAHADVVLNGHMHLYERYALQDPAGLADPAGIRQFIVGTGGESQYTNSPPLPTSQVQGLKVFGILALTLHPTSYAWSFVEGNTPNAPAFSDSGSTACHGSPGLVSSSAVG